MVSERQKQTWSPPRVADFSGHWNDLEAALAPNGRYIIFASDRPATSEHSALTARYYNKEQIGGRLWRVDLFRGHSGVPCLLPAAINSSASVWTPSVASNNDLYFMHTDPQTGRFRLMVARASGERTYSAARPLAFSTGSFNDVDPAVDPQQRFLIFSSDRGSPGKASAPGPERLYIAFAPASSHPIVWPVQIPGWSDPTESQVEARLSPDGRWLYFASPHPGHTSGEPKAGDWDNGKANIWVIALRASLWHSRQSHLDPQRAPP
jgi:Tol biopolymer transport system component